MRLVPRPSSLLAFASLLVMPTAVAAQSAAPPPGGYFTPQTGFYPYYPPPAPSPQSADPHLPPPLTLPYDDGQTVPQGYKVKTQRVRAAVIAGASTFGTSYIASLVAGAAAHASGGFAPLFAPVVGPFITVGTARSQGAGTLWLALDGMAQTAGATVLIYGLVAREKFLEYDSARGPGRALAVLVHPEVLASPRGGAVRWTF
jgi:hypothetical protein